MLPRWARRLRVLFAFALSAASLVAAAPARADDLPSLLAYDASLPLGLHVLKRDVRHGAWVGQGQVLATIVRPIHANGPHAGIVWGHWFEPAASDSNRSQFVREAAALSRLGVVSVMPDARWSEVTWFDRRSWRDDYADTLKQAKDFRRTIDVLLAQDGVDPQRVAFVGHDFSAMHGALIAGVETRVKAWVLIAGTSRWIDWYAFGAADGFPAGDDLARYREQLARIDPVAAIARNAAPALFQFGEQDFYTPRDNFTGFYAASARQTSRIATYASKHPMQVRPIRLDRDLWLAEQLALSADRGSLACRIGD